MTWAKYFSRWFREAGRSHLAAVLSWGFLQMGNMFFSGL